MSADIAVWRDIRSWGTLLLSVTGRSSRETGFISTVRIVPASGREISWVDEYVKSEPCELIFTASTEYTVRIGIKFIGESTETAVIAARVLGPTGSPIADTEGNLSYRQEVSGRAGDPTQQATLRLLHHSLSLGAYREYPVRGVTSAQ